MFKFCGRDDVQADVNLEEEMQTMNDLFEKQNDGEEYANIPIATSHKVYRKYIANMVLPTTNNIQETIKRMKANKQIVLAESLTSSGPISLTKQPQLQVGQKQQPDLPAVPFKPKKESSFQEELDLDEAEEEHKQVQVNTQPKVTPKLNMLNSSQPQVDLSQSVKQSPMLKSSDNGLQLSQPKLAQTSLAIPSINNQQVQQVNKQQMSQQQIVNELDLNELKQEDLKNVNQTEFLDQPTASIVFQPQTPIQQSRIQQQSPEYLMMKQQLEQQNLLFQEQMKLIRLQQEKLLEAQKQENENKIIMSQLKQQLDVLSVVPQQMKKVQEEQLIQSQISQQKLLQIQAQQQLQLEQAQRQQELQHIQSSQVQPTRQRMQNAKLSLTATSLCGFDGQTKLFEINLGVPGVVEFQDSDKTIKILHESGPIIIRAETKDDYVRWKNGVMKAIENSARGTTKGLVMKLDQTTKMLYVYKGDASQPSKIFNVANCVVELKYEGNNANVKVRCVDGRKFSFGDTKQVCEQWARDFEQIGGVTHKE
ncbi:Conserved_hypothetical protein [Hexamita inflata]|uniref:Uncharacterized protein n=1 Tax=Hexamita inflata TaxID=28002 RepID=A0AA86PNX5_9EUKA|nr:Conserved hypothetical protein [Hexamita inflata]